MYSSVHCHHHRPYLLGSAPVTWPGYKTASRGSQHTDHRSHCTVHVVVVTNLSRPPRAPSIDRQPARRRRQSTHHTQTHQRIATTDMNQDALLCVTDKGVAHVLDLRSGASLLQLKDCKPCTHGLCATSGFVLGAERNRSFLHVWSWRKEQPRFRCQAPERITCIVCTADGAHCIGGSASGKLYLWQVATGRLLLAWDAHFKPTTAVVTALCDGYILSAGEDALVLAWSFIELLHAAHTRQAAPQPFRTWSDHTLPVVALAVAPLGQHDLLASAADDQTIRLWRVSDACRGCIHSVELGSRPTCVAVHPSHSYAYAGGADGRLYAMALTLHEEGPEAGTPPPGSTSQVERARGRSLRWADAADAGPVRSVASGSDGSLVYTCSVEPGIRIWDAHTLALLQQLQPTMGIESFTLVQRPLGMGSGGTQDAGEIDSKIASDGAAGAEGSRQGAAGGGVAFNVQPLKKFSEAASLDMGLEASARVMGCVPCNLSTSGKGLYGGGGGGEWGGSSSFSDLDLDEGMLPLMTSEGAMTAGGASASTAAFQGLAGSPDGRSDLGRSDLAAAEATIRQLRGQLDEMHRAQRDLYVIATDAVFGGASAQATRS